MVVEMAPGIRPLAGSAAGNREVAVGLNLTGLRALFEPGSVAVLGASSDPSKIGGRPIGFLRDNGFTGSIYPINPRHDEVQGLTAFPTLSDVGRPVDLALVAVPRPAVLDAVQSCAEAGVTAVTVFSAGFAETGSEEGVSLQARMADIGREAGMRILGPNCLGSVSRKHGVCASFAASERVQRPDGNVGGIALISQSGAIATYCVLAGLRRGVTLDPWISTGNESDVQLADCLAYLALDDEVKVIAAYLEGCRDGDRLRAALALAREREKPVILLKAGRSEAGSMAAVSHTASLAGSEQTFEALVRQYNVCRAESVEDLVGLSYTFGFTPPPRGSRAGIVTSSGGAGILMADAAAESCLEIPPLPPGAQAQLREIWPAAGVGNPIDTTAQVVNDGQLLSDFLQTVLRAGTFDSVIIFLSYIGLFPDWSHVAVTALRDAREKYPDAEISVAMLATPDVKRQVEGFGIRTFDDPTAAVRALGRSAAVMRGFARDPSPPPLGPRASTVPVPARTVLSELDSAVLLDAAGIPVVPGRRVQSADEAASAAAELTGPLAVKVISADLPHKTDVGGVLLDVRGPAAAAKAYLRVIEAVHARVPDAVIDGVLLSPMVDGGTEAIMGVYNDAVFGPTVMFGLGGVFVESIRDVTFRLAPFSPEEAMRMVGEIRGRAVLEEPRGAPPRDLKALATTLSALSVYADEHRDDIESIDVNPLLVLAEGDGVIAVDAVITGR
jgi:acyl-CoA synthetase (NDP forming)